MAHDILAHPDEYLYQINFKDLEILHHKLTWAISQLSILSSWISFSDICTLSLEQKGEVDGFLCAVMFLLKDILKSLPEL